MPSLLKYQNTYICTYITGVSHVAVGIRLSDHPVGKIEVVKKNL